MNTLKTVFLMTALMVMFIVVGGMLGGQTGMIFAFIMALVMNFGSYWFSDKLVLKMYGARQVGAQEVPQLYRMIEELAHNARLPMPKVYVMDSTTPNAFATGRNPENAAVAVTTGILRVLDQRELAGVIAHELAHIRNRDILTGSIVAAFVSAITFLAQMAGWAAMFSRGSDRDGDSGIGGLVMIIVAPIAATLLQLAISRSREYAADADGAAISHDPLALASALDKLSRANEIQPMQDAKPASAHMFIVSPLTGGGISKLFSTHPPMEERIKRLKQLVR
ncbi:MAG: zinc metalloprotease HtpX [Ignavibacteriaceae bacterium]|nr:zinc metalloprotease HtpX [Ignavibacteriaceae bacterium]